MRSRDASGSDTIVALADETALADWALVPDCAVLRSQVISHRLDIPNYPWYRRHSHASNTFHLVRIKLSRLWLRRWRGECVADRASDIRTSGNDGDGHACVNKVRTGKHYYGNCDCARSERRGDQRKDDQLE